MNYIVPLPDDMPPLSLNDRTHWAARNRNVQQWRDVTKAAVKRRQVPPMTRARITLHVVPPDNRRRDRTNLVASYKACVDGVVDSGRLPDDSPAHLDDQMPVLHESDRSRRWKWWLTIEPLPAREDVA